MELMQEQYMHGVKGYNDLGYNGLKQDLRGALSKKT